MITVHIAQYLSDIVQRHHSLLVYSAFTVRYCAVPSQKIKYVLPYTIIVQYSLPTPVS